MNRRGTPKGIQSLELGGRLLAALSQASGAMTLGTLAQEAGMSPSKARRYLISFGRVGLVEQDESTSRYDLGWFALRLGLSALQRRDIVRQSRPLLAHLREQLNETIALVLWASEGPTVMHFEESDRGLLRVVAQLGATLPLLSTAGGRLFAAYSPPARVDQMIARELKAPAGRAYGLKNRMTRAEADRLLVEVRARGLARTVGEAAEGVSTMAAPVRDKDGSILAAIVALGHRGSFDARWNGKIAVALRSAAAEVAQTMGHGPPNSAAPGEPRDGSYRGTHEGNRRRAAGKSARAAGQRAALETFG